MDPRLDMPALWKEFKFPALAAYGVDVTQALAVTNTDNSTSTPAIWLPDLFFPDATSATTSQQFVRISPGGNVLWSRHITLTLVQSAFNYKDFPADRQTIKIRFTSYGHTADWLQQHVGSPALSYFLNAVGEKSFTTNSLWYVKGWAASAYNAYASNMPGSMKSHMNYDIAIQRQSGGLVFRLAVPTMLIGLLGALAFWAKRESRVDTTANYLIAISALYIVIFQYIPMVNDWYS